MTIPTKDDALRACDELSDYAPSHPYAMSLRKTLRSYIESHTGEPLCPRSANGRPESFTVRECVSAGECGCGESVMPGSTVRASPVQPVKLEWREMNSVPEEGQILGFVPCKRRGDRIEIIRLRDGKPFTVGAEFAFDRSPVTHWMPLPTPPLSGGDK